MINVLWFILIIAAFIVAACNGKVDLLTTAIFQAVEDSVNIVLKLIGPMSFWLGLMNVAQKSRLNEYIAEILKPIIKRLFPEIPEGDPASFAIIMNLTANILGLGNSATSLGIKAMQELDRLNNHSDKASPAMCTLLAINTSSITIIPSVIISLRAANGSSYPAAIIISTLFATGISTITALIFDRFFRVMIR